MNKVLSGIGRSFVNIAAVLTILAGARIGYTMNVGNPYGIGLANVVVGTLLGGAVGLLTAGIVFGLVATVYDIRDSLRTLVTLNGGDRGPPRGPTAGERVEPHVGRPGA
jgi:hypothetical protein